MENVRIFDNNDETASTYERSDGLQGEMVLAHEIYLHLSLFRRGQDEPEYLQQMRLSLVEVRSLRELLNASSASPECLSQMNYSMEEIRLLRTHLNKPEVTKWLE